MKNIKIKFGKVLLFLFFLIYETSFSLVIGKTVNEEKTDCAKLSPFVQGLPQDNSNSCCDDTGNASSLEIECDDKGYFTSLEM